MQLRAHGKLHGRCMAMFRHLYAALLLACSAGLLCAQDGVDYHSDIQPIFTASCSGGFCHVQMATNGVELTSYSTAIESVGISYAGRAIVPGDAASSPLFDKIANETPENGSRMPLGGDPLTETQIDLIRRWIDEGAREFDVPLLRGDANYSGGVDISDAIFILDFLFLGGPPPTCQPLADASADFSVDISDPIYLLTFLFLGGDGLADFSEDEIDQCRDPNAPPDVDPIGTLEVREATLLEFAVRATDADGDNLSYTLSRGPDGMAIDADSGVITWTPDFGTAGDYRLRVRVTDDGAPPLWMETTGLIRVVEGNHPPELDIVETMYGRETVPISMLLTAVDSDGDDLTFDLLEGPSTSSLNATTGLFEWNPVRGDAGEHVVRVRVSDDGDPPRQVEGQWTIIVVDADSPLNQPPVVRTVAPYRTYPDEPIAYPLGAQDPDGHAITYEAVELPDGATLDASSGLLTWTPDAAQVGPLYLQYIATDNGLPPESTEGLLVIHVQPLDPCTTPDCDPATGCDGLLAGIEESCCEDEPTVRVPEPVADCPLGRVLHVGRNTTSGFGRMQNCDRLRIAAFGQGGHVVQLNIEARCIDMERSSRLNVRLETAEYLIFEETTFRLMRERSDGYGQALALFFPVIEGIPTTAFDETQALLTVMLTDANGVVLERQLRLVLTRRFLEDLPEADTIDVPAGEVGCVGCHRPLTETGERHGIEDAHPWYPLTCTECHGGDASANTREAAHVPSGGIDFLRNLGVDELDQVPEDYIQFINPGDLRVAAKGCGSQNPANPGSGCHQAIVDTVPTSVMATFAGHYDLPRYLAGVHDREESLSLGAVDVVDEDFDPLTAPTGAVQFLRALREPEPEADRSALGTCIDVYLPKSCPTCHLNDFGPNNAAGNYRSSGCTACHMVYDEDGLSRSADPVISKDFPPHPKQHVLTSAIPTEQCQHCHFQGGRIGLAYQGIREGGFSADKTPEFGVTLGRDLHAHDPDYYFSDEDDRNDIDETPPDVHHDAGMVCADCHIGGDVHGDGNLYVAERYQVGARCEDCHGTVRQAIEEDPDDGLFKNSKGFAFKRLRRAEDGRILLELASGNGELEVPQIKRLLDDRVNAAMIDAMGVNEHGYSHTDSMECYTCHTSWRQTCFGCHVTIDDTGTGHNNTTGEISQGAVAVSRDNYSLDFFALGMNERGKISPLCSSMSVFMTYIDENGVTQYRDRTRTSGDGKRGFGWNPFHHHTVSRVPQNCDQCHPAEGEDNTATLRTTYGFGSGQFMATDGLGNEYDLSAFLDEDGELISDFPHPNTGPVPTDVRERALSIEVVPQPRQGE